MNNCVFCRIINREIKSNIVYEDDNILIFKDINPQAPVHLLAIPKVHIETLNDVNDFNIYKNIFEGINNYIKNNDEIRENGYRIVANCGKQSGQEVFHIHFHILSGRQMKWPPG